MLENFKSFSESSCAWLLGFSFEIVRQQRAGQRFGVAYSAKFINMSNLVNFISLDMQQFVTIAKSEEKEK